MTLPTAAAVTLPAAATVTLPAAAAAVMLSKSWRCDTQSNGQHAG
jgi:hypothetical protein